MDPILQRLVPVFLAVTSVVLEFAEHGMEEELFFNLPFVSEIIVFGLMGPLMRRPGEVLSSEELARQVWGAQYANEIGFVRRYIWHLRQKVEPDPEHPRFIHNERGYGYRFEK